MTPAALSERDFQAQVVQLAQLHGWLAYHTFDSRRSAAGFPDLVLVRGPELIFAELKTDHGTVRAEQDRWLASLEGVADAVKAATGLLDQARGEHSGGGYPASPAVDVYVWRPAHFMAIHDRLRRRS